VHREIRRKQGKKNKIIHLINMMKSEENYKEYCKINIKIGG